ncbi:major facilitator superfamily domain-containing protein [Hygrophoropsis aurantiaca]|uniref:Major facilitator superfamily domain-containing protein n=1 Tax=Hygrophoropsis aurantiaca TaxID=72124 RepID=A0ACB8AFP1_9AGAM|nr:major facilitator superfamily domain-containing protein [Hygrophoropsis aurantiaca]
MDSHTTSTPILSRAETLVDVTPKQLSFARKLVLLILFCLAQFLDAFNNSALISAIPALEVSMGMTGSQSAWILSAFQLTFSSFLLISGRISDVYNPKTAFIGGVCALGLISLGAGFVQDKIVILTLRALMGIASAMTVPAALTLIVKVFPEPLEQSRAIGVFGGTAAIANVIGILIGALFVQYASYHWVFWFVAIVAGPVTLACIFLIPAQSNNADGVDPSITKWKRLDLIGVSTLTVAIILFIFAITSGSTDGWGTAIVLAPLIISILLVVGFFYWETITPADKAAIPPRTWFLNNFSILFAIALLPFFWFSAVFLMFTTLWQSVFHWSVISTAVHMLPIGVSAFATSFTGPLSRVFSPKWIILTGLSCVIVSTTLIAIGGGKPDQYWSYIFPALIIGSVGTMLSYTHSNVAIFQAAPASMAGTVGAVFNGALQFGSAIGLAAVSSIESSVEATHGGPDEYTGRAASFWFLLGIVCLEALSVMWFYRTGNQPQPSHINSVDDERNDEKTTKELDPDLPVIPP